MGPTIGQRKSYQQCFDAEDAAELRDNRDAATFANERNVAVESFAQRTLPCFAEKFGSASFLENQFVAIDWKLPPSFALPIFERLDAIIESCDCHTTLAIVKCGEQLR